MTFTQAVQFFCVTWILLGLFRVWRIRGGLRRLERELEALRRERLAKGMMPRRPEINGTAHDQASDVPWSLDRPQARGRRKP